jgi:hypothetical protein
MAYTPLTARRMRLAKAHAEIARLTDALQRAKHRYELARSIIERAESIEAQRERIDNPNVTLH